LAKIVPIGGTWEFIKAVIYGIRWLIKNELLNVPH
jgi:hypothetical protein